MTFTLACDHVKRAYDETEHLNAEIATAVAGYAVDTLLASVEAMCRGDEDAYVEELERLLDEINPDDVERPLHSALALLHQTVTDTLDAL